MDSSDLKDWDWEAHKLRRETGLLEHICPHGVGHPNPGSILWMAEETGSDTWGIHGCDGCCSHESFPTFEDSLVVAHAIIRRQKEIIKELIEKKTTTCGDGNNDG